MYSYGNFILIVIFGLSVTANHTTVPVDHVLNAYLIGLRLYFAHRNG